MQQDAQKPRQKFCARKTAKMEKTHPKSSEKGETGCVLGAGEGCSRCGRVGKPEIRTKANPIPIRHVQKENRRKPRVSAGFVAGAEGLEPSARGFGVDVETNHGKQGKAGVARFSRTSPKRVVLVWCYGEIFRAKTGKKEREIPGKTGNALTKIDTGRIIKNAGQTTLG